MGFNLDRRMYDMLGTIPTVPGAIGAFRRAALAAVGGVSGETLAEDTDLTMALCRSPWRVVYVFSVYGLVFLNPVKVTLFWLGFVLLQELAGGYALWLDRERLRSLWVLPLQQLVYRQLLYLVTIHSVIIALLGTRQRWQATQRAGVFAASPPQPMPAPGSSPPLTGSSAPL